MRSRAKGGGVVGQKKGKGLLVRSQVLHNVMEGLEVRVTIL